eukprot:2550256-Pyramimonas_sp.AAC.1
MHGKWTSERRQAAGPVHDSALVALDRLAKPSLVFVVSWNSASSFRLPARVGFTSGTGCSLTARPSTCRRATSRRSTLRAR